MKAGFSLVLLLSVSCHCAWRGRVQTPVSISSQNEIAPKDSVKAWLESGYMGRSTRQGGAITLDPVSIISLLALGAFLINNILQLLRTNQMMNQAQSPFLTRSLEINPARTFNLNDQISLQHGYGPKGLKNMTQSSDIWSILVNIGASRFLTSKERSLCLKKILQCSKNTKTGEANSETFRSQGLGLILSIARKVLLPSVSKNNSENTCHNLKGLCDIETMENAKLLQLLTFTKSILARYGSQ